MALAAILMVVTAVVAIFMQPAAWVIGCMIIGVIACMFLGFEG